MFTVDIGNNKITFTVSQFHSEILIPDLQIFWLVCMVWKSVDGKNATSCSDSGKPTLAYVSTHVLSH